VSAHHDVVGEHGDPAPCQACHGADYRGTELSRAKADRTLSGESGTKQVWPGFQIGCYTCHRGPNDDDPNPNRAAVVSNASAYTASDVPVAIPLAARDADGDPLALRIVSQPAHGTTGLVGTLATYRPEPGFAGVDRFTFAAWDGSTDSNLATVVVSVGGSPAAGTPIDGQKLTIKDRAVGPTLGITFQSRDGRVSTGAIDPTVDGATLHVFNSVGGNDSACFTLPSSNWRRASGAFRYVDAKLAASPVKAARVKNGLLKVIAKGNGPTSIGYRLGEPSQGSVGVLFTSGATTWCANFGGVVKQDSGTDPPNAGGKGRFVAKDAPAPGACPTAPVACP
jgi:hypothetical protein